MQCVETTFLESCSTQLEVRFIKNTNKIKLIKASEAKKKDSKDRKTQKKNIKKETR